MFYSEYKKVNPLCRVWPQPRWKGIWLCSLLCGRSFVFTLVKHPFLRND